MREVGRFSFFKLLFCIGVVAASPGIAVAQTAAWRFEQIYSNFDGNVQFIVIYPDPGSNQNSLDGFSLTSVHGTGEHGHDPGYVSTFDFPNTLPAQTKSHRVLIGTQAFADLNIVTPDFIIENQFIPQQTGIINLFRPYTTAYDSVTYDALPSNAVDSLYRDGTSRQNMATNFAGQSAAIPLTPPANAINVAVEYYYADWNAYFVTAFPDEIALLDAGAFNANWKRTGQSFKVWNQGSATTPAACRFFSTSFAPRSSHFYTPFANECVTVKQNRDWQFEAVAFYMQIPFATGTCAPGATALYRLYNNGAGGAPNHRYTTSAATLNQMMAAGWTFEGDGNSKVFACVPL